MAVERLEFGFLQAVVTVAFALGLMYVGLLTLTATAVIINGLIGGMLTHGMKHLMF